jgi:arylsulfatase A-like enzyme
VGDGPDLLLRHEQLALGGHRNLPPPPAVDFQPRSYAAAIADLDSQLGDLLDHLLARGRLDRTLVILTADHGEEFAEHRATGHGRTLYTQAVRVPLAMVWPGRLPAGVRLSEPVSLARLPATVMALLGRAGPFPGPSLVPRPGEGPSPGVAAVSAVSAAQNQRDRSPASGGSLTSVLVGRYRYIQGSRDSVGELYDHQADPLETRNLVGEPGVAEVLGQLRDTLALLTGAAGTSRSARPGPS